MWIIPSSRRLKCYNIITKRSFVFTDQKPNMRQNKGFTLIELLIVIAIVAVLSTVVLLYVNPAELLKQSRDSNRLTEMSSLNHAIALYLNDTTMPSLGVSATCYAASAVVTSTGSCLPFFQTASSVVASVRRTLDSTGWVPIDFVHIISGVPLDQLPADPSGMNDPIHFYAYISGNNSAYKLAATMESQLYGYGGSRDVVSGDNGISTSTFETGTNLSL